MKFFRNTILFILMFVSHAALAQNKISHNVEVSLITCAPGEDVYSLFGHTALRLKDESTKLDIVFNYGIFSFSSENFVLKFVKGETYYTLGVYPFDVFLIGYINENRSVWEQKILLDSVQKSTLIALLINDNKPENREYLYNFLYNNCSTKIRDHLESSTQKHIYFGNDSKLSTRQLLKPYLTNSPWTKFGINLALGSPLDNITSERNKLFLPLELKNAYNHMGMQENIVFLADNTKDYRNVFTPLTCIIIILIVLITIHFIWKISFNFFLYFILGFTGVAGLILTFLSFISIHPAVYPNYNLLVYQPFNILLLLALCFYKKNKTILKIGLFYNIIVAFTLPFVKQSISIETYFISALIILSYIIHSNYLKWQTNKFGV